MIPISLAFPLAFFFQAVPTYTIAGTVVDSITGAALSRATVSVSGVAAPVITGKDGAFRFDGLKAGKYQLRAERLGYVAQNYAQRALYQKPYHWNRHWRARIHGKCRVPHDPKRSDRRMRSGLQRRTGR